MTTTEFIYSIEAFDDEKPLGNFPVELDLEPAAECLRLAQLRAEGTIPGDSARITPEWGDTGEPRVGGFIASRGEINVRLGTELFQAPARALRKQLVDGKRIVEDATFRYKPLAFRQPAAPRRSTVILDGEVTETLPPIGEASIHALCARGTLHDAEHAGDADFPVLIPQRVLEELEALTRAAGGIETGGVLIGRLVRDALAREIAVEVTALIAAEHTQAKSVSLTFTPETWAAVDAAVDLRRRGEIALGWAHSHPVHAWDICKNCRPEQRAVCALRKPFLSSDDLTLNRAVFSRAFNVALLASHDAFVEFALFGWREGVVRRRAYHVLPFKTAPSPVGAQP